MEIKLGGKRSEKWENKKEVELGKRMKGKWYEMVKVVIFFFLL